MRILLEPALRACLGHRSPPCSPIWVNHLTARYGLVRPYGRPRRPGSLHTTHGEETRAPDRAGGRLSRNTGQGTRAPSKVRSSGGRVVPGKLPRSTLRVPTARASPPSTASSSTGSIAASCCSMRMAACSMRTTSRSAYLKSNGLFVRNGRPGFADAGLDERFNRLLRSQPLRRGHGGARRLHQATGSGPHRVLISLFQPCGGARCEIRR